MPKTITISDEQAELLLTVLDNDNFLDDGYSQEQIDTLREVATLINNN
jgi:hypothetical protein